MEIIQLLGLAISTFGAGFCIASSADLRKCRADLREKADRFDDITRRASEANLSIADKIMKLEERVNSLDFTLTQNMQNAPGSAWKQR